MIGVISRDSQKPAVEEFFQLFKVPWEFYDRSRSYDVVISTDSETPPPHARLVIIFGSGVTPFDRENGIEISSYPGGLLLEQGKFHFPVYGNLASFQSSSEVLIRVKGEQTSTGIVSSVNDRVVIRVGYDLFDEIEILLTRGQSVEHAHIPAVEVHIAMLRSWILESGTPLLEIPPVPGGYNFIVCLTHDVDFIGIRNHYFDRTMIGFILRILFPFAFRGVLSRLTFSKFLRNVKALVSLPGVYLGLIRDFWFQLDRYTEIEKGRASTFFFIPFKNHPGEPGKDTPTKYRSARYDVNRFKAHIEDLLRDGREIGTHGLDAWIDSSKGREERMVIRQITGEDEVGVRMHWLCFSENSPKALEEAGFLYDSTLGFNDGVGYRCGTAQVFRLPGTKKLFELPLHIQDTAMFYPDRMGLSEARALVLCTRLIDDLRRYGGALTVNWHQRSLAPERNWDDFYMELLRQLEDEHVWFATAKEAVCWFRMRRAIRFEEVNFSGNKARVKLCSTVENDLPGMRLRVHYPTGAAAGRGKTPNSETSFVDLPFSCKSEIVLTVELPSSGSFCRI